MRKDTTPKYEFYRTIYDRSTVSKIINNSGIEIRMNSSAKKNGYGKIDLTIPAYTHGTVSSLSGGALVSLPCLMKPLALAQLNFSSSVVTKIIATRSIACLVAMCICEAQMLLGIGLILYIIPMSTTIW